MVNISFLSKPDYRRNPVRTKGLGKVGLVGIAATINDAFYKAIGKRMGDLPVAPDKIFMA